MKKTVLALSLFLGLSPYLLINDAIAGIPVVDMAAIAKTVEEGLTRAEEAAKNLAQLKEQYEQSVKYAQEQKERLEGFTDFRGGFDNASSYLKNSLSDISNNADSDLGNLRRRYNLTSSDSQTQSRYDAILKKITFYEDFNESIRRRADRITNLQNTFSTTTTPQQKADIANQLSVEQMTMDMQIKQFDIAERQMASSEAIRMEQARNSWIQAHSSK